MLIGSLIIYVTCFRQLICYLKCPLKFSAGYHRHISPCEISHVIDEPSCGGGIYQVTALNEIRIIMGGFRKAQVEAEKRRGVREHQIIILGTS